MTFKPPIDNLLFCLAEVVDAPFGPDFDAETCRAVLEAAGAIAAETIAPLNRAGDVQGVRLDDGGVHATPGFAEAYRLYREGGWMSLSADPAYGGQGLPKALDCAVFEMIAAANTAFSLCPVLTAGAAEALHAHGTEPQKERYLPKLLSGEWTGTMQLTEPQAGSDLGLIKTRAEPAGDGRYRLFGQKIFITWGDHDMAENIVHLVLARLPDAPEGSRGISLFVTSKRALGPDGAVGEPLPVRPIGVEHKLGIHGSPTCTIELDGAEAELVGEPNKGLAHMFTMMNAARLRVGVQGVALAERAYQQALGYAVGRPQGRSPWTGAQAAPIVDHPDVRRMLVLMRAKIEAARAICLATAVAADDPSAQLREEVLTPIAKAWSTEVGVEVASLGIQVHGGAGYIEETGAAQHLRDARITPIYEGTNGIQAMDLVGRKLALADGEALRGLVEDVRAVAAKASAEPSLARVGEQLAAGAQALEKATGWLSERPGSADAAAGAWPFLMMAGDVLGGAYLAKAALSPNADDGRRPLARVYGDHVLAAAPSRLAAVTAGAADLEALGPEMLAR
jgi:alkylation response protein AidB-like acyl-CoA dehydrogenase